MKGVWHTTASKNHLSSNQRKNNVDRTMRKVTWQGPIKAVPPKNACGIAGIRIFGPAPKTCKRISTRSGDDPWFIGTIAKAQNCLEFIYPTPISRQKTYDSGVSLPLGDIARPQHFSEWS